LSGVSSVRHIAANAELLRRWTMTKVDGFTRTERFLARLARSSFLSLWSYPNPYRDQGRFKGRGHGKELCDLLVVCGDDVVIFSDKECAFPETGRLHLDWTRWYRAAIHNSARQIYGAENKIRAMPERIFLDPHCTIPVSARLPREPRAQGPPSDRRTWCVCNLRSGDGPKSLVSRIDSLNPGLGPLLAA